MKTMTKKANAAAPSPTFYTVIYGETAPVWNKEFQSWGDTIKFIKRCLDRGDRVFGVVEGERL